MAHIIYSYWTTTSNSLAKYQKTDPKKPSRSIESVKEEFQMKKTIIIVFHMNLHPIVHGNQARVAEFIDGLKELGYTVDNGRSESIYQRFLLA